MKHCPRCSQSINCKVDQINSCWCMGVSISKDLKKHLEKTHYNCLCTKCLEELEKKVLQSNKETFSVDGLHLVQGKHYYMEERYMVFTEYYHLLRGYCCESGCRHCAYGYKEDKENKENKEDKEDQ